MLDHKAHAKAWFAQLHEQEDGIEAALGEKLVWYNPESAALCRIQLRRPANIRDKSDWATQHLWLREKLEKLKTVFAPRVKALKVPAEFSM